MSNGDAPVLERFKALFNSIGPDSMDGLDQVYGKDVVFQDPLTEVRGFDELQAYFSGAYSNVISCRFDYGPLMGDGPERAITWRMYLRHKKLSSGREVQVDGISHLRIRDDRVIYHRDYFDAGQMLYENVPVLGTAVRWLRRYAA